MEKENKVGVGANKRCKIERVEDFKDVDNLIIPMLSFAEAKNIWKIRERLERKNN